jgi:23S rRNA (uracil1939-C5)-methyltransferase
MADRKKVKKVPESVVCQKNDIVTLEIIDMGAEGEGIARLEGYTLFVKDALVGDIIKACVMKTKKRFGYARLLEILEPSPYRVDPKCSVAKQCGGCQLQHCSYEKQLLWKQEKVLNCLQRIGGFQDVAMEPILAMDKPFYYRNKAQFPVGVDKDGNLIAGFYASRTHSIIQNTDCVIQHPCNREIVETVLQFMRDYNIPAYNEKDHLGMVRHILTRVGVNTGEVMVCLVINGSFLPEAEELKNRLLSCRLTGKNGNPELIMKSICININKEKTNVILGQKVKVIYGDGFIKDKIGNIIYQISPLSFYQVNPEQTKKLYDTVLEFADLQGGEVVWDLYCGIGSISLFLAQKAAKVCGVEIVPEAIEDARKNAALNHISNTEFFVGAAEEVVPEQYGKSEGRLKADVVTLDPPRKGCDEKLLETVVGMEPKRIVYVSCDPATLARDLRYLCDQGYEIQRVRACDMFGMGYHVETVVMLSHKKPDSVINVKVEFGEGKGKVPLDNIAKRAEAYKPKERVTYRMIKEYIEAKYGFKVHTAYIAEVKRELGLPMYDAPNAVEELKQPRKHPTAEKVEAIKDALKHFKIL